MTAASTHSGFILRNQECVPGNQRWFDDVAWGHNISDLSIREQGLHTLPRRSLSVVYYKLCCDNIGGLWKVPQPETCHNLEAQQMLTSSHVSGKCYAKVLTFSTPQCKFADLGAHRDQKVSSSLLKIAMMLFL